MILSIDHVAFSPLNFDADIEFLKSLGYRPVFVERNVRNLEIKRKLLRQFDQLQDLALFTKDGNISIELVNHRHIYSGNFFITPLFENIPERFIEVIGEKKCRNKNFIEAKLGSLEMPVCTGEDKEENELKFQKMILKTRDIEKSLNFWSLFGFRVIESDNSFAHLEFKSLLKNDTYQMYLQKEEDFSEKFFLDDKGCNCIAFITNSVRNEKELLEKKGIILTETEKISLNKKELNVFFAIGPSGEPVEVIGIEKI